MARSDGRAPPPWDPSRYHGPRSTSPYTVSLAAGAVAGLTAEVVLFPLDCLKTRVQSKQRLNSLSVTGLYRGCGTAMCGSVPASAIFWSTYELVKGPGFLGTSSIQEDSTAFQLKVAGTAMLASAVSELTASFIRVPVDLAKQRLQVGYKSSLALPMQTSIFVASWQATALRDVAHSSMQFAMYEYMKVCARQHRRKHYHVEDNLPHWMTAAFGSFAGMFSAVLSTPFDLVKTRVNLRTSDGGASSAKRSKASSSSLVVDEARQIYNAGGVRGFFTGAAYRASWMGLGGFIFLGTFEFAKDHIERSLVQGRPPRQAATGVAPAACEPATGVAPAACEPEQPPPSKRPRDEGVVPPVACEDQAYVYLPLSAERLSEPFHFAMSSSEPRESRPPTSASVSFTAGLVAGVAVDVPLHPVDTVKTRMQSGTGFWAAGGVRGLWSGLSATLVMQVPGSAIFFLIYEQVQQLLENNKNVLPLGHFWRDGVSACLADTAATLVRVPCEVVKQRMQVFGPDGKQACGGAIVRNMCAEGPRGFFAGLSATVMREVPFALIQMPLFEELKQRHPWSKAARASGDTTTQGLVGMTSGALAGAVAGFLTTPLDLAKTRLMLTERSAERQTLVQTIRDIASESGARGLFAGVAPRTLYSFAGGALWLGAFEWSKLLLERGHHR